MKAIVFDPAISDPQSALGGVTPDDIRIGGKRRFRKGHRFTADDLADLARVEHPIHIILIEPDEIHEDDAAIALAEAIAGQGVERRNPIQSRVNLIADRKGLLRVDRDAVIALNRLTGISVFTLLDGLAVVPGKNIAGAKISPVAVQQAVLDEALAIAARAPVVEVKPFTPKRVSVVTTEGLGEKVWDRFRASVEQKIGWYGSSVTEFRDLLDDPDRVAEAITEAIDAGAAKLAPTPELLADMLEEAYSAQPQESAGPVRNPFGDGFAAPRIVRALARFLSVGTAKEASE